MIISLHYRDNNGNIIPIIEDPEIKMLDSSEFNHWYYENMQWLKWFVNEFVTNYGWAFAGCSEFNLNIIQMFKEHPYNLEDKFGMTETALQEKAVLFTA